MGIVTCHNIFLSFVWLASIVCASREALQEFIQCEDHCSNFGGVCTDAEPYQCTCPKGSVLSNGRCENPQERQREHELNLKEEIDMLRKAIEHRKEQEEKQPNLIHAVGGLGHAGINPYQSHSPGREHNSLGYMDVPHTMDSQPLIEKLQEMQLLDKTQRPIWIQDQQQEHPVFANEQPLLQPGKTGADDNGDDSAEYPAQGDENPEDPSQQQEAVHASRGGEDKAGKSQEAERDEDSMEHLPRLPTPAAMIYPQSADQKTVDLRGVSSMADVYFLAVVAGCSIAGFVGLVVAGVCWCKMQQTSKALSEAEYPAYGVTGPARGEKVGSPGDRKLAQSAQMYHFQHQKQQMLALEKNNSEVNGNASEEESEEENEEGDYTVYECPGLAPTGEMEVRNPLYSGEVPTTTSSQTPTVVEPPAPAGKKP